jgi:hypothetical protein
MFEAVRAGRKGKAPASARRTIVELQHVRESSTYDRFLYDHCVGLVEQIVRSKRDVFDRDVYALVLFTRWPDDPVLQYGRATCDLDPVTEEGQRLDVYRHRLVFLNARAPKERLPEAVRPIVALIEDTLDGRVDETRYHDEVSRQILSRIQWTHLKPDENARVKDEGMWEAAKQEEQQKGLAMGRTEELRTSIGYPGARGRPARPPPARRRRSVPRPPRPGSGEQARAGHGYAYRSDEE